MGGAGERVQKRDGRCKRRDNFGARKSPTKCKCCSRSPDGKCIAPPCMCSSPMGRWRGLQVQGATWQPIHAFGAAAWASASPWLCSRQNALTGRAGNSHLGRCPMLGDGTAALPAVPGSLPTLVAAPGSDAAWYGVDSLSACGLCIGSVQQVGAAGHSCTRTLLHWLAM